MKRLCPLVLCTCLLLFGCTDENSSESAVSRDLFAMDTYMTLKAYGDAANSALSDAAARITDLEALLSVTEEGSDVWNVNHADGVAVAVFEGTYTILEEAHSISERTDGALDITIYPVLTAWGFTTGEYNIPDVDTLAELLTYVDYTGVKLQDGTVSIPENAEIDLGALAKGYTGDAVMSILEDAGVTSAIIISLGGNVQALGSKPDGSDWTVAVLNPFASDENMCILEISDKAVITSGSYERYFVGEDVNTYWHIIDAADGYPADNGLVSVTIIGDSGLECDALSTALFVAGAAEAEEYWRSENGSFDMILVTEDAQILITEGIADAFENLTDMTVQVLYLS